MSQKTMLIVGALVCVALEANAVPASPIDAGSWEDDRSAESGAGQAEIAITEHLAMNAEDITGVLTDYEESERLSLKVSIIGDKMKILLKAKVNDDGSLRASGANIALALRGKKTNAKAVNRARVMDWGLGLIESLQPFLRTHLKSADTVLVDDLDAAFDAIEGVGRSRTVREVKHDPAQIRQELSQVAEIVIDVDLYLRRNAQDEFANEVEQEPRLLLRSNMTVPIKRALQNNWENLRELSRDAVRSSGKAQKRLKRFGINWTSY